MQPIGIIATLKIPDMDTAKYFFNKMIDPEGKIVFKNLTQMLSVLDVIRQFLYNQGKTMKDLMPGHTDDEVEKMIVDLGKRLFPKFFETQNVPLRTSELGIF